MHRRHSEIGTGLHRACLQRLMPGVSAMRADIDAEAENFPDLLARYAEILRDLLGAALDTVPEWALKEPAAARLLKQQRI